MAAAALFDSLADLPNGIEGSLEVAADSPDNLLECRTATASRVCIEVDEVASAGSS